MFDCAQNYVVFLLKLLFCRHFIVFFNKDGFPRHIATVIGHVWLSLQITHSSTGTAEKL